MSFPRTSRWITIVAVTIVLLCTSIAPVFSYTAYVLGRKTLPGCSPNEGVTCVLELDLPGPPENPGIFSGEALIDYNTATQVSGVLYVAEPVNPYQFVSEFGFTINAIWYTSDGSPCPIPNP